MRNKLCAFRGCRYDRYIGNVCFIHRDRLDKKYHQYTVNRFWDSVDKSGDCWLWLKYKNRDGYGEFSYYGTMAKAHRVSWMIHNESPIPSDKEIAHICHNPSCVNPAHLLCCSHRSNMRQSTIPSGKNPKAIVPHCVVKDVVRRYKAREGTQKELAEELTELGWPTKNVTISHWVRGDRRRTQ